MSKEKLIPELRFPEFEKNGEWETESLGDVADVYQPKTISQTDLSEEGYPVYGANGIIGFYHEYNHETNQIAIACRGSSCGTVNFTKPKSWITGNAMVVNVDQFNKIDKEFMFFQLDHANLDYLVTGSGQPQITGSIKKHEVFIPPLKEEQQKIASCLSSLDELIAAHNDKLDALKDHKKGLMQNLFPQEGETVPKVRFPEFEGDGEWELKPLEELCKLVRGPFGGALKKEIFVEEGYAVYEQSHAIYSDFRYFRYRINEEKYNELKRFSVRAGDLIMSCSGTMGKFSMIPDDSEPGVINQALLKLSVRNGNDIFFVKTSLETDTNQRKLLSQSAGGAIKNVVSVSQIRILELAVPKMREQQKISSCLSALDELITAQQEKIEQLQQHKKGLMQGLFPKIND